MIHFNVPPYVPSALQYMQEACGQNKKICGDGPYTKRVSAWLEQQTGAKRALLTTSCSHALDMMAMLSEIGPGDEVILPSYNFVSGGNAVALRGGTCVFVDIRPDTMNLDETRIEAAITKKTKAIMVMHYAGVACEMDAVMDIAGKYNLAVWEDAAQGMLCTYRGKTLGTIGDFGAYSFHETKNYSMGEGGCLLVNRTGYSEMAEILREKGTDRSKFWRGQVDKYTWQEIGSSYLPSDLNAAYLYAQLELAENIWQDRMQTWERYDRAFRPLLRTGRVELPVVPEGCRHNGHMYYLKCADMEDRTRFIEFMKQKGVMCVFHYIPLHLSPAGQRYGRFCGEDRYTTKESERLVRLPLYYGMDEADVALVIDGVMQYFGQ